MVPLRGAAAVLLALLALSATRAQAAPKSAVLEYLNKNGYTKFAGMLSRLTIEWSPGNTGTLLAPTNAAIDGFLKSMGLTDKDLVERPQLIDMVTSYHYIPGFRMKSKKDVPANPTVAATGDINYILSFVKATTGETFVNDVQGNSAWLKKDPVQVGNTAILPIDTVMKSGAVFNTIYDAARVYPDLTSHAAFMAKWGLSGKVDANMTMFVPDNKAYAANAKYLNSLTKPEVERLMKYHTVTPAQQITSSWPPSKALPTQLPSHSLKVDATYGKILAPWKVGETVPLPLLKVTPEVGPAANATLYNVFVGKGIVQGVDGLLIPKADTRPAGRRLQQKPLWGNFDKDNKQQYSAPARSGSVQDNPATTFAPSNTGGALSASAKKNTQWGTYMKLNSFANAGKGSRQCYNCGAWQ